AAGCGGGGLPRGFALPVVRAERLQGIPGHARLEVTASEGADGAIDLGWVEAEPLIGRPPATAQLTAPAASSTVVFATEQSERLRTFLDEGGVREHPREVELDL